MRLKTIWVKTEALLARKRNPARDPARQNEVRREPRQNIQERQDLRHQIGNENDPQALALPEVNGYELQRCGNPLQEAELLPIAHHQSVMPESLACAIDIDH